MSAIRGRGEVLGWGSFGKVFRGWDELLDRPVAVKELVQPFAGSEAFVRAYFAQALRMVDVSHPNLLAIYSVDPNRFPPALTREMAEQPVAHRLLDGPLAPDEVSHLLRHALDGLGALHGRGLLHLSIRPENLLISKGMYKVGDFGLPQIEGAPPIPTRQLKYWPPELLDAQPNPSPAVDLYSLGLVAWELLVGPERLERLFEAMLGSTPSTRDGQVGDPLWSEFNRSEAELPPIHEVVPSVSASLSLVLERLVRKDRSRRFESARDAAEALGDNTASPAPASSVTAPASTQRGEPPWLGIGVLVALIVAGAALWFGVLGGLHPSSGEGPRTSGEPSEHREAEALSTGDHRPAVIEPVSQESGPGSAVLGPAPDQAAPPSVQDLATELRNLARHHPGLTLAIEPPQASGRARVPMGSALHFRVAADRRVSIVLFALSSTGTLTRLYPGPQGRSLELTPNRDLTLPLPADERAGYELITTPPAGTDLVFLLASDRPLPPLPPGQASTWVTEYSDSPGTKESPARRFVRWIERLQQNEPDGVRLALQEVEVVAAE